MKRNLLNAGFLLFITFASMNVFAQISFSDDFESYTPGDLIAASSADWSTWSGGVAGEDAVVSDAYSLSGSNSLAFITTASTGGPQDVILPFGGTYNAGDFNLELNIYIPAGQSSYFNIQAVNPPGTTWAFETYLNSDGTVQVISDASLVLTGNFNHDEWTNVKWDIDLTTNNWELLINDESLGSFSNYVNSVASLDIFPAEATTFYIDDISFSHEPLTLSETDGLVSSVISPSRGLVGENFTFDVTVRNTGTNTINSFDLVFSDGISSSADNFTGVSIPSLEFYSFTHSVTHSVEAVNDLTFRISNVNGLSVDDVPSNDVKEVNITGVVPAPDKMVVFEEGTGTWCGWCPRGAVFMDLLGELFPDYFAGVAVHNGDPMANPDYDPFIGAFPGFTGYPGVIAARRDVIDPLGMRDYFYDEIDEPTPVRLQNGADFIEATQTLNISVTVQAKEAISSQHKLVVVITEDGVTGTASGFAQTNYYAGGANGPMGGFESLPDPVPASSMVYNHTARAILTSFGGISDGFPASMTGGDEVDLFFSYSVPEFVNPDNIDIISFVVDAAGEAVTADKTTIEEAEANGYTGTQTGITDHPVAIPTVSLSPNPAHDQAIVNLNTELPVDLRLEVLDISGKSIFNADLGQVSGQFNYTLDLNSWTTGMYFVRVSSPGFNLTKKLNIVK